MRACPRRRGKPRSTRRGRCGGGGSGARDPSQKCPRNCTPRPRSEEHTSELQSQSNLVCRLLLEKKHTSPTTTTPPTSSVSSCSAHSASPLPCFSMHCCAPFSRPLTPLPSRTRHSSTALSGQCHV